MDGHASIAPDVLASYAADAARDVDGVRDLVESHLPPRKGVRVEADGGRVTVEFQLAVGWGRSAPDVAREVQARVREYLARMADVEPSAVDVVVAEFR